MTVNPSNIFVGAPDQLTTGAVRRAPAGTPLPATAIVALNAAFANIEPGYVDEAGVTVSPTRSTTPIRDWSRQIIRQVLESFDGKVSYAHLELNEGSMKIYAGDNNVTLAPATEAHGTQLSMAINGNDMDPFAWVFNMKDGVRRARIVLPRANVTEQGQLVLVGNGAIKLPVVLSTYPDAAGNSIYVYTDDGIVDAA